MGLGTSEASTLRTVQLTNYLPSFRIDHVYENCRGSSSK